MAKKKVTRRAASTRTVSHTHPKATMITWIVFLIAILCLVAGYMIGKIRYTHYISEISVMFSQKDSQLNSMKATMQNLTEIIKENGKVMVIKNGKVRALTSEMTLADGTVVMPNGKYRKPDGSDMMLENGQAMDMSGKMIEGNNTSF